MPKTTSQKKTNQLRNTIETGKTRDEILDQLFEKQRLGNITEEQKVKSQPSRKEFSLFSYNEYYEREIVRQQIKELTAEIKKEIELIKKADASLLSEIKDIQKLTLEAAPNKPGVYHIRFLEVIMSILRAVRAKVNESKTWLEAMVSRRKKRGSLFMSLSKKKGTQYSLSQELQATRAVQ